MFDNYLIQWAITSSCEFSCSHCYLKTTDEPTEESVHNITNQILDFSDMCSLLKVNLTGGNPLHSSYLPYILQKFNKIKGVKLSVLGNPLITDNELLKSYADNIDYFQLSYDGSVSDERCSEYIDRLYRSVKILKSYGIKVNLMMTLSKKNRHDLIDFLDSDLVKIFDSFSFNRMVPQTNVQSADMFTPVQFRSFLYTFFDRLKKNNIKSFYYKDPLWKLFFFENGLYESDKNVFSGCGVGNNQLAILPNSEVVFCGKIPEKAGDLRHNSLKDIINKIDSNKILEQSKFKKCSSCPLFHDCRGCMALSYKVSGELHDKDPQCWITN